MPLDSVYVFPACNRLSRVISEMPKCRYYSHYNEVITKILCMKVIDLTCPLFVAFPECARSRTKVPTNRIQAANRGTELERNVGDRFTLSGSNSTTCFTRYVNSLPSGIERGAPNKDHALLCRLAQCKGLPIRIMNLFVV